MSTLIQILILSLISILILALFVFILVYTACYSPVKNKVRENAQINAWRRYFSRVVDSYVYLFFIYFAFWSLGILKAYSLTNPIVQVLILLPLLIVFETGFLFMLQTSPGKILSRLKLNYKMKIPLSLAFLRSASVYIRLIPIIGLITILRSYRILTKTGDTAYDRELDVIVTSKPLNGLRIIAIIFAILGLASLNAMFVYSSGVLS